MANLAKSCNLNVRTWGIMHYAYCKNELTQSSDSCCVMEEDSSYSFVVLIMQLSLSGEESLLGNAI